MLAMTETKELVLAMARQLVENPDAVRVESSTTGSASVLLLKVAQRDLGRVIGKNGRTIDAIRVILSTIAAKHRHQIVFDVREASSCQETEGRHRQGSLTRIHAQTGS